MTGHGLHITDHRITWMDFLRGVAILLVIVSHATDMATGPQGHDNPSLMAARAFFAPYRMSPQAVARAIRAGASLRRWRRYSCHAEGQYRPRLRIVGGRFEQSSNNPQTGARCPD